MTRRPLHPSIAAGLYCLTTSPGFLPEEIRNMIIRVFDRFLPACADVTVSFVTCTIVTQAGKTQIIIWLISSKFDAWLKYVPPTYHAFFFHERHSRSPVISKLQKFGCNKDKVSSLHPKLNFVIYFWKAPWNDMSVMFKHFLKAPQILWPCLDV